MQTNTISNGSKLKNTLKDEQAELLARQERLQNALNAYVNSCKDVNRVPCASLMLELLGDNARMAVDNIYEMKHSITDILVLLTDPEVLKKFQEIASPLSSDVGKHLKWVLHTIDKANNPLCFAEMALYELENFQFDEKYLNHLELDFEDIL